MKDLLWSHRRGNRPATLTGLPDLQSFSASEILVSLLFALFGLVLTYVNMFLVRYGIGIAIIITYLVLIYSFRKEFVFFIIFTGILFINFIYNPGTKFIDFFLINAFRIYDPAWLKGVIRIQNYILPAILIYSIIHSMLSRNRFSPIVSKKILPWCLGFIALLTFSYLVNGGSPILFVQLIFNFTLFFLVIIAIDGLSLSQDQIIRMLRFVFFCMVPLQMIIVTTGLLNVRLFLQDRQFGDLVVGTTELSSVFFLFMLLGFLYHAYPLVVKIHKWDMRERISLIIITFFLFVTQSGLQLMLLATTILTGFLIISLTRLRIRLIIRTLFLVSVLGFLFTYIVRFPAIADNVDYLTRTFTKYSTIGVAGNPKLVGYRVISATVRSDPFTLFTGRGPGSISEVLEAQSMEYAKTRSIAHGQAATNQTTLYTLVGDFGLPASIIFYLMLFVIVREIFKIYRRTQSRALFTSMAMILFLCVQSLVLFSFEKTTLALPVGVFVGLTLKFFRQQSSTQLNLSSSH